MIRRRIERDLDADNKTRHESLLPKVIEHKRFAQSYLTDEHQKILLKNENPFISKTAELSLLHSLSHRSIRGLPTTGIEDLFDDIPPEHRTREKLPVAAARLYRTRLFDMERALDLNNRGRTEAARRLRTQIEQHLSDAKMDPEVEIEQMRKIHMLMQGGERALNPMAHRLDFIRPAPHVMEPMPQPPPRVWVRPRDAHKRKRLPPSAEGEPRDAPPPDEITDFDEWYQPPIELPIVDTVDPNERPRRIEIPPRDDSRERAQLAVSFDRQFKHLYMPPGSQYVPEQAKETYQKDKQRWVEEQLNSSKSPSKPGFDPHNASEEPIQLPERMIKAKRAQSADWFDSAYKHLYLPKRMDVTEQRQVTYELAKEKYISLKCPLPGGSEPRPVQPSNLGYPDTMAIAQARAIHYMLKNYQYAQNPNRDRDLEVMTHRFARDIKDSSDVTAEEFESLARVKAMVERARRSPKK
jgi:hypothetical protein